MAHPKKNYTVLLGFPLGGGHWSTKGQTMDLLDVQAHAWLAAGRIKLTSEVEAESAASTAKKSTAAVKESK